MATDEQGRIILPQKDYNEEQKKRALEEKNMYFVWLRLGRPPTPDEAGQHFANEGGAEEFARTHVIAESLQGGIPASPSSAQKEGEK
ncbi:MAG: hypothetical protein NTW06_04470 [Candidatus Falkowbacteria bacterium]|nr:hypothetical protein [Candidatus Falkowbacteria bacterium]